MDQSIDLEGRLTGEIVFVKNPNSFWARSECQKCEYARVQSQLQSDYAFALEESSLAPTALMPGRFYCIFNRKIFEWQRCELLSLTEYGALVFYIDVGNMDLVPAESLRVLKEHYVSIKSLVIHCSLNNLNPLHGNSWSSFAIKTFNSEINRRIVTLYFKSKVENKFNVELYVESLNINEVLISKNLANNLASNANNEKAVFKTYEKNLDQFSSESVSVTSIYSPYYFYVQETTQEFTEFEAKLQNFYESQSLVMGELSHPQIGQMCVAKYSEDQAWYRATVKEIDFDQNRIRLFFVDYGNEEEATIRGKEVNICDIADEFKLHPAMALKCSLCSIKPIDENKTSVNEIADFMFYELGNKVWAKFIGTVEDFYYVDLDFEKKFADDSIKLVNLKALLVEKNYAQFADFVIIETKVKMEKKFRSNSLNRSQLETIVECKSDESISSKQKETFPTYQKLLKDIKPTTVVVTYISSPYCFYVQETLESYTDLEYKIQKYFSGKLAVPLKNPQVGQICVAKYSEDSAWYRATIKEINHDLKTVRVFFVDYGNEDLIFLNDKEKNLCEIPDEFKKHPAMGLKCSLKEVERTSKTGIVDFIFLALSGLVLVRFLGFAEDYYYVDVTFEQTFENGDVKLVKLSEHLIKNGYAISTEADDQIKTPVKTQPAIVHETFKLARKGLNDKKPTSVTVTHISSPYNFYVQEVSNEFTEFEQTLQKYYTSHMIAPLKNPQIGQICVAKYSEDSAWYRATIKEINHDLKTVRVFFVDYGNEDLIFLNDKEKNLCEIASEFKKHPVMATKCSLHGIESTSGSKIALNEVVDFMFNAVTETVMAKFIDMSDDLNYVDIYFDSRDGTNKVVNLKTLLLERKYAQVVNAKQTLGIISNQHLKMTERGMSDKLEELSDIRHIINDKFLMENVKNRNS